MRLLLASLLLLPACSGSTATADQEHYLAAVGAPFAEAVARCGQIRDVALRGECRVQRVREEVLSTSGAGLELCEAVADADWRGECVFLVVDTLAPGLDEALRLCADAGRFIGHCRGHAFGRALRQTAALYDVVGREQALEAALTTLAQRQQPRDPEERRQQFVRHQVAAVIAGRFGETFDPELCGVADETLCARAWELSQQDLPGGISLTLMPPVGKR